MLLLSFLSDHSRVHSCLCSLEGDWQEAMRVRTRMQRAGVSLTLHVYNALIAACERAQQATTALDLYHAMQREGIRPNYATLTPLAVSAQPTSICTMVSPARPVIPSQHCC